jgi:hypothetical protein
VKELLPMTAEEEERLVWIHSNKFIVPDLFNKKFIPDQSYRHACRVLSHYARPEIGFLHTQQDNVFQRVNYYLTAPAIRTLDANNKILVRSTKYPVKINPKEKDHDLLVQAIRISLEASDDLKSVFWVSDFELRSGISPSVKAEFLEGKLNKKRWRSIGFNPNPKGRRTPDGYFEGDLDGERMGFTLEYEHHPYGDKKITDMVDNLKDAFPHAFRLVVSSGYKNALRMIRALKVKVKAEDQEKWFITNFEKAATQSFKGIWHQLNKPLD